MSWKILRHRDQESAELDDEIEVHLAEETEENICRGMRPEEARRQALLKFGNPQVVRETVRQQGTIRAVDKLLRDLRYGMRTLARSPGFALISIVIMALGIGANVALFTVIRSVLLKPLPFTEPERLVRLYEQSSDGTFPFNQGAGGVYAEWKKQSRSFVDLAMSGAAGYNLSGTNGQLPETVRAFTLTSNILPTLGVQPALGRNFSAADDRQQANATVILSWSLWKRRYGGSVSILGQTVLLDTKPYTVIGVMPAKFAFPDQRVQLWTPLYHEYPETLLQAFDDHEFTVIGRLKPGVTGAMALAELSLITRALHSQHRDNPFVSKDANLRPLLESIVGDIRTPLYILLGATGCVLLIACLNVANLLVARSAARQKELAIRAALGGSRLDLLRQHLAESFLLAAAGGGAGLLLAWGGVWWFVSTRHDVTRVEAIHLDGVVVLFALGLVALCAAFAGLISALAAGSGEVLASLQESSRSHSGGRARTRLREGLLSVEVGLTVVLLIGAGLMLKSYAKLRGVNLGCNTHDVLKMDFNLPEARYNQPACVTFFRALLARTRAYPGIAAAGLVFPVVPGDGYGGDNGFSIVGQPPLPPGQFRSAMHRWSDPGYFAAIGIPILRGHTFDEDLHGHPAEVIISESFAKRYFPGEDPVGQSLITLSNKPHQIVGVVGDTRIAAAEAPRPTMYFPLYMGDWLYATDYVNGATLVVRAPGDVTRFSLPLQKIFQTLDPDLPVAGILTMDQVMGRNNLDASFDATLLMVFAMLSLLLAAVGLFGVLSYVVAQRTTEIGIRIALGAQRGEVMRLMLGDGLRPALAGLVPGLIVSAGATRLIQSMLYGTQPLDLGVFVSVTATLLVVAAAACAMPAWRASRLDPIEALRAE